MHWIGCGDYSNKDTNPIVDNSSAIILRFSLNITIQNCHFWYSKGPAIVLSEVSGEVNIRWCDFLNTHYRGHGAVIHYTSSNTTQSSRCLFTIKDCNFAYNKFVRSLVYIENIKSNQSDIITICNSSFYYNQGVSVYVINQQVYINGKTLFWNNFADDGSGIYITNQSTIIFGENADVDFTENIANHKGSVVFQEFVPRYHSKNIL